MSRGRTEFQVNPAMKKQVVRSWFFGSNSGKIVAAVTICLVLLAALCVPLADAMFPMRGSDWAPINPVAFFAVPMLLVCALLCIACGYRQITADTAMRTREIAYIDGDRLVCTFKISNDLRPQGMNVVSIGLASSSVRVRGVAVFTGDVLAAYITDWHDGATVPLNLLAPMSKPFKLGLHFEPDLLETIRPYMGSVEG